MKKMFIILLLTLVFFPAPVLAHMMGQPPFFKINGVFTNLYPVPTSSTNDFDLPQDIADKSFLVGESLQMELDVNQLPILPEIIDNTTFSWEYGDGAKADGLKNTHIYTKPGSYFMTVYAKYQTDEPQLIQSTLINVLPDHNYQLPQAKLMANGQESRDPLTDIIKVDFKKAVSFSSENSFAQSKIVKYYWDFGDGRSSTEPNPTHMYAAETTEVFPVLRVTDDQGFISDTFIQLDGETKAQMGLKPDGRFLYWQISAFLIFIVIGIGGIWWMKSRTKK